MIGPGFGFHHVQYTQPESDRLFIESIRLTGSQVAILKTEVKSRYRKLSCEARAGDGLLSILSARNYPTRIVTTRHSSRRSDVSIVRSRLRILCTLQTIYFVRSKTMTPQTRYTQRIYFRSKSVRTQTSYTQMQRIFFVLKA